MREEMAAALPPGTAEDYCPYDKPFRADFAGCACFAAASYVAQGLDFVPAGAVTSCGNLVIARLGGSPGTHYAACAIGDAAARQEVVAARERSLHE